MLPPCDAMPGVLYMLGDSASSSCARLPLAGFELQRKVLAPRAARDPRQWQDHVLLRSSQVPTDVKVELVNRLVGAGLRAVEVTSFVSPKWVPQLADARDVLARVRPPPPGVRFSVLTPNMKVPHRGGCTGCRSLAEDSPRLLRLLALV